MPKKFIHSQPLVFASMLMLTLAVGCGGNQRKEDFASVQGKVSVKEKAVPSGAQLVVENKTQGIRMMFPIGEGGSYSIPETAKLPVGTYDVGITPPPSDSGVSEANYDKMMSNPTTEAKESTIKDGFPVPEKMRDPATSGKSIDVKAGSQTINIDLGA